MNSNNVLVYPNPFADRIQVDVYLSAQEKISIELYSVLGSKILELPQKEYSSGLQQIELQPGHELPNGVYFLKISSGSTTITKKISK